MFANNLNPPIRSARKTRYQFDRQSAPPASESRRQILNALCPFPSALRDSRSWMCTTANEPPQKRKKNTSVFSNLLISFLLPELPEGITSALVLVCFFTWRTHICCDDSDTRAYSKFPQARSTHVLHDSKNGPLIMIAMIFFCRSQSLFFYLVRGLERPAVEHTFPTSAALLKPGR